MMFMGKYGVLAYNVKLAIYSDRGTWFIARPEYWDGVPRPATRGDVDAIRQDRIFTALARPLPLIIHEGDGGNGDFTPVGRHVIDFSGVDFSRVRFERADFRGAKLTGARFANATLVECRFDPAGLSGLDCSGAHFSKCDFTGFNLTGTNFSGVRGTDLTFRGATLTDCDFRDATMIEANFAEAKISGGSFAGANLTKAVFGGDQPATFSANVDFAGADLALADFSRTSLLAGEVKSARPKFGNSVDRRTKLAGARVHAGFLGRDWSYLDCTDATIELEVFDGKDLVATFLILPAANFAGKSLAGAQFHFAILPGARFGNCDLQRASFRGAVLGASDFSGADLGLADFGEADLSGAGFSGAYLKGAKFTRSLLLMTDFSNAFAAQADFTAIRDRRMQGVSFNHSCLVSASFHNVEIVAGPDRRSTFTGACLLGTNFSGAKLTDVTLTNAKLASKAGTIKVILEPRARDGELRYEPTQLSPDITGPSTLCPDGRPGRCTNEQLITDVPDTWSLRS
jgi:uncharacterized protein YjbI with pentapeptide repeats